MKSNIGERLRRVAPGCDDLWRWNARSPGYRVWACGIRRSRWSAAGSCETCNGILQLWLVWHARHLRAKYAGASAACRLHVRIVATDAAHASGARAIALAERHRVVVLDVVGVGRRFGRRRDDEDRKRFVERAAGANIAVCLSGLEHANVAGLMTGHANVIRQVGGQVATG